MTPKITKSTRGDLFLINEQRLPLIINKAGEKAQYKFIEYFTATISNKNTREAYARSVYKFLLHCEVNKLELETIHPVAVASYFRQLETIHSPATVKQNLAAIKGLFDWFVTQGVMSYNPAASVKGPKYAPREGKTPVLTVEETRQLFDSINGLSLKDYRDRAILSVLFYAWVRVSALVQMNLEDYQLVGERQFLTVKEKGGKTTKLPLHHKADLYLRAYLKRAKITINEKEAQKLALFRSLNRKRELSTGRLDRTAIYKMVQDRAFKAGLGTKITPHSGRGTGITTFLENGGRLEVAQQIAMHADSRTTRIYDRRQQQIDRADIERVQY